jgi:DNA-directed RNA polymerase subunit RPC12/RpoP
MSRIHDHHGTAWSEGAAGAPLRDNIRLPLVKREYTIGPATFLDPIYGFRWVAIPATSYRCPHCGHLLHADFWSGNVRLGPGVRRCAQCGEEYDDGSREWPQLSFARKLRFCCPPILAGISGGIIFAAIVVLFLPQPDLRVTVIGLIFAFVPVFVFFLVRLPWVLLSIRRYNARAESYQS